MAYHISFCHGVGDRTQLVVASADNLVMPTDRLRWYVTRQLNLASWAAAGRMKRLTRQYLTDAVAAVCRSVEDPVVVFGEPPPKRHLHGASGSW
jgi:hypothetical protein